MSVALTVLVALVLAGVVFGLFRPGDRRPLKGRPTVIVNMRDETAVEGVLWSTGREWLVVKNATLHQHGKATQLDGEAVLPRSGIAFVQKVT